MNNKFDKIYEETMDQIDEGLISDVWDKINSKSFDRIIMYDFVSLIGDLTSSNIEKRMLMDNIVTRLKAYPKIVKDLIKFYHEKDNVKVNSNSIFRILKLLSNNSNKGFEIHKQVRDNKSNGHIKQQLQKILSI